MPLSARRLSPSALVAIGGILVKPSIGATPKRILREPRGHL
jgi:hypothetical protein